MSSPSQISDDDESFEQLQMSESRQDVISISSDNSTENYFTSDDEFELPAVNLQSRKSAVIKNLFPTAKGPIKNVDIVKKAPVLPEVPKNVPKSIPSTSKFIQDQSKRAAFEIVMGGVKIHLPVDPYGCQKVLMFKVITAINKRQNCLLESPTGSGKTLALLCGALAWQRQERNRIAQSEAQQYFTHHPELSHVDGMVEYLASPPNSKAATPEKLFGKTVFGEKSIYDKPSQNGAESNQIYKRQEPLHDSFEDSTKTGQVRIHKKPRLGSDSKMSTSPESHCKSSTSFDQYDHTAVHTPEKRNPSPPETPQSLRNLYSLVENLQLRTSMVIGCSVPTIYYGARTHKQIQQVVKEFSRTAYCGEALMTILSSREYSCIREFDRNTWGSKNDMCKGCIKPVRQKESGPARSNCEFYDNRQAMNHKTLPPAFDLEDLVKTGENLIACPYYAARAMAMSAQIVFCPYNYLIEPGIRASMQIDLRDNILVIDEAHNIEDICRDAATFTFSRDNVQASIAEFVKLSDNRYMNANIMTSITHLIKVLRSWDDWFVNHTPLVDKAPVNNSEAVYTWEVEHFVTTLNNHNIGEQQYNEFSNSAESFCQRYRESPETLHDVTQATCSLIESMDLALGYLLRDSGVYKDDFKPALIRTVYGVSDMSETVGWRNSQFNQKIEKQTLSLRLLCLNPAVIFAGLKQARCIILASGTLTPLVSLHSELTTEFPLKVSPNHIISKDRVWIGSLTTCPDGQPLECQSRGTEKTSVQDALGQAVLWVSQVTPNGVLCFLPSYMLMNKLCKRWQETGLWKQLNDTKHVFMENRKVRDHNDIMDDYYKYVSTSKGALLFAVYRGKVSEGMDFKDHQARAVIAVGVPYPNTYDMAVKEKMKYNEKHSAARNLLSSREWLRVQAYRALNQAVGRCVRHKNDWGAVLLVDARFSEPYYTEHLSKWVKGFLGNNHHTYESLVNSSNSLESFMQNMTIKENEDFN